MTVTNRQSTYTAQATADLSAQSSRFKVININGTLFAGAAGTLGGAIGVNITSPRSGECATYVYDGITKCVAGSGGISTVGYPVCPASGGFIAAAASGGPSIGRALELANSGDFVECFVDFTQAAAWPGV
jgi:hypothetical protein